MDTTSYWNKSTTLPRFRAVDKDYEVDVAVVGAGITGVTAAYLIKKAGHKVALLERGRCGGFDSGNTTAHLTCVTDTRLHNLASKVGKENAQLAWESGRAAIDQIVNIICTENIECDFRWVSGYHHLATRSGLKKEKEAFENDARLASELGFAAKFIDSVPLVGGCGVEYAHQAKFSPLKYLGTLLRSIPGDGSHVFEHSEAEEFQDKPLGFKVNKHRIRTSYLVLATHNPLTGRAKLASATLFQSKLFLYTSYAIGAIIPTKLALEALYWDTAEPYHYLRIDRHRTSAYAILGGEDHKTGQLDKTPQAYTRVQRRLKKLFPAAKVDSRWSGQVVESADGLPFIGELAKNQFVATAFAGNGMTFGTLAGMMALDAWQRRRNPWQQLYDVHRKHFSDAWRYARENKDYPYYLLRDWLSAGEDESLNAVARNEGKILKLKGRKVAAYRDEHGKVTLRSPVCTHLKCIVRWNSAEKTWDCPCHGSRFATTGEVLSGPAEEPLEETDD